MNIRQKYYVTLNPQELGVGEIRDDSQLIQYEVEVSEQELNEIQQFIEKYSDELYDFSDIILQPFNEGDVNEDNQQSLGNLEELYRVVYKFGTDKTKRYLENIQRENNSLK